MCAICSLPGLILFAPRRDSNPEAWGRAIWSTFAQSSSIISSGFIHGTKKSAAVPPVKPLGNLQDGISGEAEDRGHDADVFPLKPCGFTRVLEMAPQVLNGLSSISTYLEKNQQNMKHAISIHISIHHINSYQFISVHINPYQFISDVNPYSPITYIYIYILIIHIRYFPQNHPSLIGTFRICLRCPRSQWPRLPGESHDLRVLKDWGPGRVASNEFQEWHGRGRAGRGDTGANGMSNGMPNGIPSGYVKNHRKTIGKP